MINFYVTLMTVDMPMQVFDEELDGGDEFGSIVIVDLGVSGDI